jgi:hypothetical protein
MNLFESEKLIVTKNVGKYLDKTEITFLLYVIISFANKGK